MGGSIDQFVGFSCVIAGLDPAIHPLFRKMMDARVKPAHDEWSYLISKIFFSVLCRQSLTPFASTM